MLERIDHMVCVVPELAPAAARYEALGLVLTPPARHAETGAENQACFVGASAGSACYLELLSVFDEATARASGREHYIETAARGGGMTGIAFGVSDITAAAETMTKRGVAAPVQSIHRADGSKVCDVSWLQTGDDFPFRISLVQYPETWQARFDRSHAAGRFAHSLPLKRLDHLAAFTPDIEAATRAWADLLGVVVTGEIVTPAMIIRQLKIGDAIFEVLGPATPESPLASRPAGLASMAAWEVEGSLDEAVALARSRGFTVSDAEAGVIPHTRRATVAAAELGGVGMQLLEYV